MLQPRQSVRVLMVLLVVGGLLIGPTATSAQVTTAVVTGAVRDEQGGAIPGATVELVSETRGVRAADAVTNANGDFVIPNVLGDTYAVQVSLAGFRTIRRQGVAVSPGDRVVVGTLVLTVGGLDETVTVTSEAPSIQAATGDRSFTVTTEAVENLPISNRSFAGFAALLPGSIAQSGTAIAGGVQRLGGGGQNNIMMDGVSTMDTGNNGQLIGMNVDAIAEVKVLAQGYQAEFGRSSGLQISAVTKSGTNQFRGSVYDIERDSDWNSNSWQNIENGVPKAVSKQRDWGYSVGGPIGKPGGANRLFFFYSHEYRPRTSGGNINRFRVPTALERRGDFSETLNNQGVLLNRIRDYTTGLPCTAASTSGCFQDGGVLGRIPQERLYGPGMNILNNLWPLPNVPQAAGTSFNLEVQAPRLETMVHQPLIRVDYQASSVLRFSGKYVGQQQARYPTTPGSLPGFNDVLNWNRNRMAPSLTVNYTLTPTMFLEATYGYSFNEISNLHFSPLGNRVNAGLGDLPTLFPTAGIVRSDYHAAKIFSAAEIPYYVDGRVMLWPNLSWGNLIGSAPPNLNFGLANYNPSQDFAASVTKIAGRHTVKAGFYWNNGLKYQQLGTAGATPFQGALNFGNDTQNSFDSGFGFANAALGVFSSYGQQSQYVEGAYVYHNYDWYLQDNWKVTNRLTLDYGMRFLHMVPTHDTRQQASTFMFDRWQQAQAPVLFVPGCAGASPCSGANRQAMDPRTGQLMGPGSSVVIGQIVPNTGNAMNGIVQAGDGISEYNYTWPAVLYAPRFGVAYDVTGNQQLVIRGGIGLFHDRPAGDTAYSQVGNPPVSTSRTVRYGLLQDLSSALEALGPPQINAVWPYEGDVPSSTQWNAGVQMALPWSSSLDLSYVGQRGFNLLREVRGQLPVDINAVDFGAAFLPENQDPTLAPTGFPGGTAYTTDLLRPLQGFGEIRFNLPEFHETYHSIQASFNRRFRQRLGLGASYTLGLAWTGNVGLLRRLEHNPDGTFAIRADQAEYEELNENVGNRRHVLKVNAVWQFPNLPDTGAATRAVGWVINDWQLSGILTAGSGSPYDITYSYNAGGNSINLTGTPSYPAMVVITGDPGSGCSGDQYRQFNVDAFSGPQPGSLGLESGRNRMSSCPTRILDLAIARNIVLGGGRSIQLRVEMYNALNTVVYNGREANLQINSPSDQTVRNPQTPDRIRPQQAGFGAVTSAEALRSVQAQIRFAF